MKKLAYIFPGQGSQSVGMGKDLFDNFQPAKSAFDEADEALGLAVSEMCFSGTEEELALTANTQPAILTSSVAAYRTMISEGAPKPDFVAGHSLGEYSALVAAGSLSLSDAAQTVRKRGMFMQAAVAAGDGAMAAILGLDLDAVEKGCAEARNGQVCSPANINSRNQIVIAGDTDAVERACGILKESGARRAIKLNVSAPFHCELMKPAQDKLAEVLEEIAVKDLNFPIVENVSAARNDESDRVRRALTVQVSSPVRWLQSIEYLIESGVETFVEVGTGKVLSGLVRQISRDVRCFNVEDSDSLRNTINNL